ncbi:MAG: PfaD family polyunsaturated fatty acid/polyketide biosynthesis protein [Myxococcota bacterium]
MSALEPLGRFVPGVIPPAVDPEAAVRAAVTPRKTAHVVQEPGGGAIAVAVEGSPAPEPPGDRDWAWLASLPPLYPEWLGARSFREAHGTRFPYVAGAMANGIATVELVAAMAKVGALGFFGAAGLGIEQIEDALVHLDAAVGDGRAWGSNLIHSPQEPGLEDATVALYLRRGVRRVSASAFMELTPAVVRYALHGLHETDDGQIKRTNHLFAKVSRPEVARAFMSPAPPEIVRALLERGLVSAAEAQLGARLPVAEDITVESDSGGHTDNRPLAALFPVLLRLKHRLEAEHAYPRPLRLGAAGGLGSPAAVAAAFGLGAAYVVTGSINQACIESGLSEAGRKQLSAIGIADVMMAPAADMFEMGVKVQVLRRGSLFGPRASRLYALYQRYDSLDELSAEARTRLETEVLGRGLEDVWRDTEAYFARRAPGELDRAARDPKHRMALVFRWYLGCSSRWAIDGTPERQLDYQIWCGPAMGAFNDWTRGSYLEAFDHRRVADVALNLLEGAAAITRAHQLRGHGVALPDRAFSFFPRRLRAEEPTQSD